ncbi:MAG: NAD kinase, partial [Micrococcaceae bacterium]|nr:NAD kinase [Micrococcaceae bacterium]
MPHNPGRRVLVLAHTGREDAISAALQATRILKEEGLVSVMLEQDVAAIRENADAPAGFAPQTLGVDCGLEDIVLGLVLGG